jgi:pimeloyl-ACP methyl ester carboxylesterase
MATITLKDGTEIYYKDWGKGQPIVFSHGWPLSADAWEAQMTFLADRAQFFLDVASGPFFGFNRPDTKVSQGLIQSWWLQGMMSGHKNAYDCIKAFSETDFTEDLKRFDVPTLIIHGDDDQIVPIGASALLSSKLVPNATLKIYPGGGHSLGDTAAACGRGRRRRGSTGSWKSVRVEAPEQPGQIEGVEGDQQQGHEQHAHDDHGAPAHVSALLSL